MFDKLKEKLLTVVKSQDEVQQEIEKRFPYEYNDMPGLTISLSSPQVWLLDEKNQVELSVDVCIKAVFVGEYKGHVGVRGQVEYNKESKKVILNDPEVIRLDIPELTGKWLETAHVALNVIIKNHLQELFCYPMPEGIVYSMIKSLSIENRSLKIAFI